MRNGATLAVPIVLVLSGGCWTGPHGPTSSSEAMSSNIGLSYPLLRASVTSVHEEEIRIEKNGFLGFRVENKWCDGLDHYGLEGGDEQCYTLFVRSVSQLKSKEHVISSGIMSNQLANDIGLNDRTARLVAARLIYGDRLVYVMNAFGKCVVGVAGRDAEGRWVKISSRATTNPFEMDCTKELGDCVVGASIDKGHDGSDLILKLTIGGIVRKFFSLVFTHDGWMLRKI